mgnify:CR=1 FL=1
MYFQYGQEETEYLSGKDEKLGAVIAQVGRVNREVDTDLFSAVVHHIVGQQISTKAQATIWQRMRGALGTVDAEHILEAGNEQLQLLGISCRKAEYITDFARKIQNGEFDLEGIWQKDGMLLTYAAVLEAEKPETLHRACKLLQDLDNYQRITEDAYGYGQQRLQETLGLDDEAIYELDGYMDFEKYGQDCMENDCVTKTEFGLLRRLDPPFPEQTQGQQMFQ